MKIRTDKDGYLEEVDVYSDKGMELLNELWLKASFLHRIVYHPKWLGIPIIQLPFDIVMMQELIWQIKPDVIVETGVAHGGSAIFYASILQLLGGGRVIGIDIEIRDHNRNNIINHPMAKWITLIEGSSTSEEVFLEAKKLIREDEKVLVVLDSNHTYDHVRKEIMLYSSVVTPGSYMVVMDGVQKMLSDVPTGKPEWSHDNPLRAIEEFVGKYPNWAIDNYYNRMGVTYSPNGFLRRIT
ncbi:MAG: class I SAM-dependent methyltransferase [Candidatus Omnitrophica bacterium]|nr:class I SAM-dependent methyltransferase [Candidatus Omnitrophota bacterium]